MQTGFVRDAGVGLNAAVSTGVRWLSTQGFDHVVVVHGDLPCASSLVASLPLDRIGIDDVILVPDRHHDGTNVLVCSAQQPFGFLYGSGSFAKHCIAAAQHKRRVIVVHDDNLALDVDTPDDLLEWQSREARSSGERVSPKGRAHI
jgi:2-phospho-L-lactate/phosphoenolpyruvate guanylyltransferase